MNGPGIAGIRFQQNGDTHYGWVRFSFEDTNHDGWLDKLTVTDWAYESVADHAITAGEIPTPEPGTMSLSVLALGSAGVLALRRRRKAQAEKNAGSQER
jgi:hypothetical protein